MFKPRRVSKQYQKLVVTESKKKQRGIAEPLSHPIQLQKTIQILKILTCQQT